MEKKFHFLTNLVPSVDSDGETVPGRVSACMFCVKCVCLSRRPRVRGFHVELRALCCGSPRGRGWPLGPAPGVQAATSPFKPWFWSLSGVSPSTSRPPHARTLSAVRRRPGPRRPSGPSSLLAPAWPPAALAPPRPPRAQPGLCPLPTEPAPPWLQGLHSACTQFTTQVRSVAARGAPRPKPDLAGLRMGPVGALLCPGPHGGPGCGQ